MKFFIKLIIFVVVVVLVLGYFGYQLNVSLEKKGAETTANTATTGSDESNIVEAETNPVDSTADDTNTQSTGCEFNRDCTSGLMCIDGECGAIADIYPTDCEATCSVTNVAFSTSDGEEYALSLGRGGYTMAGALSWVLMNTPNYCPGETPLVPIKISSRSGGEIVGEKVLVLQKAETSEPVSHALAPEPTFTITLNEITEECG